MLQCLAFIFAQFGFLFLSPSVSFYFLPVHGQLSTEKFM